MLSRIQSYRNSYSLFWECMAFAGAGLCQHLDFRFLASKTVREKISVV